MRTVLLVATICLVAVSALGQLTTGSIKSLQTSHNKIDAVNSASDIDKILDSIDKRRFEVFIVKDPLSLAPPGCQEYAESLDAQPWTKADFDNNGLSDLLIIGNNYGHAVVVVLALPGNKYDVKTLTRGSFQGCSIPVVHTKGSQTFISYHTQGSQNSVKQLSYKFGDFVEMNGEPTDHAIEKIEIKISGCYGTCPSFEMSIERNGSATFKPIAFNKKRRGTYKTRIDDKSFGELSGLLNYIGFPTLSDSYSVSWTDDQTSVLTVTYDGGRKKKIVDYGLIGSFGLSRVYDMFFELRENQKWR